MKKVVLKVCLVVIIVLVLFISFKLVSNKTFFKTKYVGLQKQEIFIPRFSYFDEECCMTAAYFYSLKSKNKLDKEIKNYMKDFKYFENESTYGYEKNRLFIQKYETEEHGLYRKIIIVY